MSKVSSIGRWYDEEPMDRFVVERATGGRRFLARKVWKHQNGHFSIWLRWITWL